MKILSDFIDYPSAYDHHRRNHPESPLLKNLAVPYGCA
jgi:hypothetical protein